MGRTELIRHLGCPYHEVEKRGLYLPVVDVRITYKKPAYYDDIVTIYTRINELSAVRIGFAYEIHRAAHNHDDLLVTGFSEHVWVNRDFKPVRLDKTAPDLFQLLVSLHTQPKRS
jgi:acyl-CoA thioester hydrolase